MSHQNTQSSLFQTIADAPEKPKAAEANGHKIVIIDGHALAFRSYYAIRELTNSKGVSTNAIYGFIRSLLRILKEEGENDATVITFDAPAKTFRHEQFEAYKAGRAPMPQDLPWQIDTIKKIVEHMGLYQIEVAGLEADDLIGTIAKKTEQLGYHVEIVTSDRDSYQLISDKICVRGLDKADRYGAKEVFAKYGVTVEQWTDYRALTGDASDNIPGAKGIGPKSAQKLLETYGSLDYILDNLDSIEPQKFADKIRDSLEDVKFSRLLSEIVTDADLDINPSGWALREMNAEPLRELLSELEFGSILRDLGLSPETENAGTTYETVAFDASLLGGAYGYVLSEQSPMHAELSALAVAKDNKLATLTAEALNKETVIHACDAKALVVYAKKLGLELAAGDDPLLMAYVLDPNTNSAEAAVRRYGAGEWGKDAQSRAIVTADLLARLAKQLEARQKELYETIEKPLQNVLADMEFSGVELDVEELKTQSAKLAEDLAAIEHRVREIADNPILNLNSRDQLAELLFDKLGLEAGKKTSTGKRSTAVGALEPLRDQHEVIGLILDYREKAKLKNTYLDPLPSLVSEKTGRIHTTFNQAVVATGRLSSTNPNLQNIPVRTEMGREIRKAFIAKPGSQLLVADYSQIELRILAHISGEEALIESFNKGEDIHSRTAAQIYNTDLKTVDSSMRRVAKIINFGVLYGMSAHRLTNELSIEYSEADAFIKTYFERYPKVQGYIDGTLEHCRKHGYVETLLGRRRIIPDINASNRNAREYAERTAYNMPIQGTAADIMKLAMLELYKRLKPFDARLTLQVHDEIIVEASETCLNEVAKVIRETMESAYKLAVPLTAEVGVGKNWLEAK